jgi:hypothetical protein
LANPCPCFQAPRWIVPTSIATWSQETPPGPGLNGRALDITRRSFSTVRVVRGDAWGGAVIVKGKLNYFGKLERGRSAIRHSEASKA